MDASSNNHRPLHDHRFSPPSTHPPLKSIFFGIPWFFFVISSPGRMREPLSPKAGCYSLHSRSRLTRMSDWRSRCGTRFLTGQAVAAGRRRLLAMYRFSIVGHPEALRQVGRRYCAVCRATTRSFVPPTCQVATQGDGTIIYRFEHVFHETISAVPSVVLVDDGSTPPDSRTAIWPQSQVS